MSMIYAVTHANLKGCAKRTLWCGPAAVSALTGQSAECAAAWINYWRDRPLHYQTNGVSLGGVQAALRKLGHRIHSEAGATGTLHRWLRDRTPEQWASPMLVIAGCHYYVIEADRFVDSARESGDSIVNLEAKRKVRWVGVVERRDGAPPPGTNPLPTDYVPRRRIVPGVGYTRV